jgi:hypothetical protein
MILGLDAVLLQEGHHVAFDSRRLPSAELNFNVTKKEMLARLCSLRLRVWQAAINTR